ncbi:hypothetical protein FEDK69T_29660 [Flavobacterium enshiense DK69]|uniref:Fibronectin type-III domain-containing protein n=1 Tax=Flavobacterium enshiense DK69 TaxID=1107311 RepID=V6S156_9FLAO|nr:T9SS type A sorting domain-containing protein [Flavobacterium enshiense]ESU20446.1 hypothetical protein FEDK69T_29660 [Flavobacterium enshiense DK69]KGO95749.1 hypothetical protein Q767_08645 [Flavobacterium enshiense DK69]
MKKFTFLIFLLVFGLQSFSQSICKQTFTVSGKDVDPNNGNRPTVLTINASDIICHGTGTGVTMTLKRPGQSLISDRCSSWFNFSLSVDGGTPITGCGGSFDNVDITGFSTLTITSANLDQYPDDVTISIDVEVAFTPTEAPVCTALNVPANGAVNVIDSRIKWPVAAGGTTGYKLNVGTTAGESDILNMQYVGNVTDYTLGTLTPGTTYYVKVIPYNAIGDATGCAETTFTTCGAVSVPVSEDFTTYLPGCWQKGKNGDLAAGPGTFIGSAWFEDGFANNGSTGAFSYNIAWNTGNEWVVSPLFTIPATGYELKFDAAANQHNLTSAPTTPWESDDVVQVLVSNDVNNWTVLYTYNNTNVPSNIGTSNIIDLDAYAGQNVRFAFRAVEGTDNGNADIDFSIDNFNLRLTPPCADLSGLTASNITDSAATITWNSVAGGYQYVLDQVASDPVGAGTDTATNSFSASPLSPETVYYLHVRTDCSGVYGVWSTVSFTTLPPPPAPPVNDICANAIALTTGGVFQDNYITGTIWGATTTSGVAPSCATNFAADVWYSVVVPASGNLKIETFITPSYQLVDTVIGAFSGACGTLVPVACSDNDGEYSQYGLSSLSLTNRTPGETLYVGVWKSGVAAPAQNSSEFSISAYDATLSAADFDTTVFKAYPNPVKDVLNLTYSAEISSVEVYNMLGQKVLAKTLNVAQGQIDMSNLNAGNYVVKVTSEGLTKTIKVVKR